MTTDVSFEPKKAYMSMVSSPSGRSMLVKAHSSNALFVMVLSVLGSVTEVQLICMPQAKFSRDVMPLKKTALLMPPQKPGCS